MADSLTLPEAVDSAERFDDATLSDVDYAPFLENAFADPPTGTSYRIQDISGTIPDFVRGTYYLNGPASFSFNGQTYRHWLDGDGMVCSLRFGSDGVHFTSRYVRSTKFVTEQAAGRRVFRGFGTRFPGDQLNRGVATESPVNVSVYPYAGMLLAFGEHSLPWQLDPVTLDTIGPLRFSGALNELSPFSAHPKIDKTTGELFNFGVSFSSERPCLHFYRFNAHAERIFRRRFALPYPASLHDFSLSETYAIFFVSPYILDVGLLMSGSTTMESLHWRPELGSWLIVASRHSGDQLATIPIGHGSDCGYCLHLINSYENGEMLRVDLIEFERPLYDQYHDLPKLFSNVSNGQPTSYAIDTTTWRVEKRLFHSYRSAPDFPVIDSRREMKHYEDFWMLGISAAGRRGRKFFDELVHARWDSPKRLDIYRAPLGTYLSGEPVFAGNPLDASGVVICQLFNAVQRLSSFAIFDSQRVSNGPIAILRLKEPTHLGFHAFFAPA